MRRILALVALAGATYGGIDLLADLTQTRPEAVDPSSRAEVSFDVAVNGYPGPLEDAARSLWAVCRTSLGADTAVLASPTVVGEHLSVTVSPAPADNASTRLRGCINDVTLDRVKGHRVAITPLATR